MPKHRDRPDRGDNPHGRVFPDMGFATGEVSGSISPKQLPEIDCQAAKVKAVASNPTNVYVGQGGVHIVQAADREDVGWELDAGEETPWYFIHNLNQLYIVCDAAGDDIVYTLLL